MHSKKSNKSHTFFGVRTRKIWVPPVLPQGILATPKKWSATRSYNALCLGGTLTAKQISSARTDVLKQQQLFASTQPTSVPLDVRMRDKKLSSTY